MVKSARNNPKKQGKRRRLPTVEDKRPISKILPRSGERGDPTIPIRTVLYVEVQDLPATDVHQVVTTLLKSFPNEHPHYAVPMRYGKLTTEFEFEGEFLKTIRRLCEVDEEGKIFFKKGVEKVDVIRKKIR